jgi:2-phospho-L-lactate guanylyltransferase
MRTAAVLPVKSFSDAKSRIGAAFDRAALAEAMVCDVLDALADMPELDVVVVTGEPVVAEAALATGATVLPDPSEPGHSAAAVAGACWAAANGADRVLMIPGDCPAVEPGELRSLLADTTARSVTVVPDRHGTGTNALLLAPPDIMRPSFGPGSCARHGDLARAAGAAVRVAPVPSLALDVDTPADLTALLAAVEDRPGAARRTRRLLSGLVVC